jgi:hypothetical protein
MAVALDGRSWATLQRCEVQIGAAEHGDKLIELERMVDGIVGWDLDREQVVNAAGCTKLAGLYVRAPWWRD